MNIEKLQQLIEEGQWRELTRRRFLMGSLATGVGASTAMLLASCADDDDVDDVDDELAVEPEPDDDDDDLIEDPDDDEPVDDGEMVINLGYTEEPPDIDPHNLAAAAAGAIGFQIMPGLVWLDYDLELEPKITESWETSEDGLSWTFALRDNLVFHNGKPCDATEVVRNFENIMDPDSGSLLTPDFQYVESVEAVDATTIDFTLSQAFAPFLGVLAHRCAITDMDDYNPTTPVGTGAFKIVDWDRGSQVIMERHDDYWEDGLPHAARVNWRFLPDADVRLTSMRAGEIDITNSVPNHLLEELMDAGDFEIDPISGGTHHHLGFNTQEGRFSDVRMRKAVAHAIDREAIMEAAIWGNGIVTTTPFPPQSPWFIDLPGYERDLDLARELMEEAGYGDGFDVDMPIPNWTPSSEVSEIVQADLAEVGINLRILETEWATYFPEIYLRSEFEITYMAHVERPGPDQTLFPLFHPNGAQNATLYSNPDVTELLDLGRVTIGDDERKEIYDQVQEILVDELPWLWLFIPNVTMGWAHNVTGFQQHPSGHVYLENVRIER